MGNFGNIFLIIRYMIAWLIVLVIIYLFYIRVNANQITKKIWVGDWASSCDKWFLRRNNIKTIICLNQRKKDPAILTWYQDNGIKHVYVQIDDVPCAPIEQYFYPLALEINGTEGNVLIHCTAGISRSATICIYYLMAHHGMNCYEALDFAKLKRPRINPNSGFVKKLNETTVIKV